MITINVGRLRSAMSTVLDRANEIRSDLRSRRASVEAEANDHLTVDPVEKARRNRERSSFPSDAEYFEFVVNRAVEASTATSVRPEKP